MNISNAKLLGFSQRAEKFDGDSTFALIKTVTIECLSTDITNEDGVSNYAIKELQALANSTCPSCSNKGASSARLIVNGMLIGDACELSSFSIGEGNWVQGVTSTLVFELRQKGSIEEELGLVSTNLGLDFGGLAHMLEDFSEDFTFSKEACSVSYDHTISLKYASCVDVKSHPRDSAPIALAKEFAGKLLKSQSRPDFGLLDAAIDDIYVNYGPEANASISENYDSINNSASFTRSFRADNPSGNTSIHKSRSFRYSDGVITISEEGTVRALVGDVSVASAAAETAIDASVSGQLDTALDVYKKMVKIPDEECAIPDLVDGEDGKNLVTRKTITTDEFLREVRYVIEVTNDPKQEDTVRWIYTTAINFNGTCTTVTESGSITGMGSPQKNQAGKAPDFEKYRQAKNKWDEIKGGIRGRLLGATSIESDCLSPKPTNSSITHCEYQGSIQYSRSYSDCPEYRNNDQKTKEMVVEHSTTGGVPRKAMQPVVGNRAAGQIIQKFGLSTTQFTSNIRGHSKKFDPDTCEEVTMDGILEEAKTKLQPGGVYLKDAEYSYSNGDDMAFNIKFTWEG